MRATRKTLLGVVVLECRPHPEVFDMRSLLRGHRQARRAPTPSFVFTCQGAARETYALHDRSRHIVAEGGIPTAGTGVRSPAIGTPGLLDLGWESRRLASQGLTRVSGNDQGDFWRTDFAIAASRGSGRSFSTMASQAFLSDAGSIEDAQIKARLSIGFRLAMSFLHDRTQWTWP